MLNFLKEWLVDQVISDSINHGLNKIKVKGWVWTVLTWIVLLVGLSILLLILSTYIF